MAPDGAAVPRIGRRRGAEGGPQRETETGAELLPPSDSCSSARVRRSRCAQPTPGWLRAQASQSVAVEPRRRMGVSRRGRPIHRSSRVPAAILGRSSSAQVTDGSAGIRRSVRRGAMLPISRRLGQRGLAMGVDRRISRGAPPACCSIRGCRCCCPASRSAPDGVDHGPGAARDGHGRRCAAHLPASRDVTEHRGCVRGHHRLHWRCAVRSAAGSAPRGSCGPARSPERRPAGSVP